MIFRSLVDVEEKRELLSSEYKASKKVGKIHLGRTVFFFRVGLKTYYIPYSRIRRCFRRVQLIPIRLQGKQKELRVERLVVCDERGELLQAQVPGENAAKSLMEDLKVLVPDAEFGKPTQD